MPSRHLAIGLITLAMFVPFYGLVSPQQWTRSGALDRDPPIPIIAGTGHYRRSVTTDSSIAQQYFDQGLAFLYGFNHEAARRSFQAAASADPKLAMAKWGVAASYGPDLNNPDVAHQALVVAEQAIASAQAENLNVSVVERKLIDAMAKRYAEAEARDRWSFEKSYADAMSALAKEYPGDPDIGALRAESFLILGNMAAFETQQRPTLPEFKEVLPTLEAVLRRSPSHPLALHLYVHALEGSQDPKRAADAADRLRTLAPAIGHLVHMPSHIDVRLGRWQQAVATNERAIAADHAYRRIEPRWGSHLSAMAHTHHMLAYAAMMQGQSKKAALAVESLLSRIPDKVMEGGAEHTDVFVAMPYEVEMRFGQWDSILAEPVPSESYLFARAMRHFARGVALAAKGEVSKARPEQKNFIAARAEVPKEMLFRKRSVSPVLDIAGKVLEGELLYRERRTKEGIVALRDAVEIEDDMKYVEPPLWMVPVRHALGAALMDAGDYAQAEPVYREDLIRHPENAWSLYGLARSLQLQGKTVEAAVMQARFEKAWQSADIKMTSSCCCLPGANKNRPLGVPRGERQKKDGS
jgi:tetratricopeptide (TPR) repeat protein